jgi:DNA-binding CsgD family transcriptional regulator
MSATAQLHPAWRSLHPRTRKFVEPGVAEPRDPEFAARLEGLTRQERNILRSRAAGLGGTAIASRYGISSSTVRNTLTSVFRKLGVAGKSGSARVCYLLGRYDADADGEGDSVGTGT